MKPKMIIKIITDIAMTAALLLLMTYGLIGEAALKCYNKVVTGVTNKI